MCLFSLYILTTLLRAFGLSSGGVSCISVIIKFFLTLGKGTEGIEGDK